MCMDFACMLVCAPRVSLILEEARRGNVSPEPEVTVTGCIWYWESNLGPGSAASALNH